MYVVLETAERPRGVQFGTVHEKEREIKGDNSRIHVKGVSKIPTQFTPRKFAKGIQASMDSTLIISQFLMPIIIYLFS